MFCSDRSTQKTITEPHRKRCNNDHLAHVFSLSRAGKLNSERRLWGQAPFSRMPTASLQMLGFERLHSEPFGLELNTLTRTRLSCPLNLNSTRSLLTEKEVMFRHNISLKIYFSFIVIITSAFVARTKKKALVPEGGRQERAGSGSYTPPNTTSQPLTLWASFTWQPSWFHLERERPLASV